MRWGINAALSLLLYATPIQAQPREEGTITLDTAKELVLAALTPTQRRLPKVEAEPGAAPDASSKWLFFTVIWEGTPNGSVVVGNYAVDPHTGDVFSATVSCYEEKNKRLQALQARVRATLHLSAADYKRRKSTGPLCE